MNRSWMALSLAMTALATPASSTTITVTTDVDDVTVNGNCTLREAIQAAQTDLGVDACAAGSPTLPDTVLIPGNPTLALGTLAVVSGSGPLVLRGTASPGPSVLNGSFSDPQLILSVGPGADVTVDSLELRVGGFGAIRAQNATLALHDDVFGFDFGSFGGALSYTAAGAVSLTVERCVFSGNGANNDMGDAFGGGARVAVQAGARARIVDSTFLGNQVSSVDNAIGGGLHGFVGAASSLEIVRSTFDLNQVDPGVGGAGEGLGSLAVRERSRCANRSGRLRLHLEPHRRARSQRPDRSPSYRGVQRRHPGSRPLAPGARRRWRPGPAPRGARHRQRHHLRHQPPHRRWTGDRLQPAVRGRQTASSGTSPSPATARAPRSSPPTARARCGWRTRSSWTARRWRLSGPVIIDPSTLRRRQRPRSSLDASSDDYSLAAGSPAWTSATRLWRASTPSTPRTARAWLGLRPTRAPSSSARSSRTGWRAATSAPGASLCRRGRRPRHIGRSLIHLRPLAREQRRRRQHRRRRYGDRLRLLLRARRHPAVERRGAVTA